MNCISVKKPMSNRNRIKILALGAKPGAEARRLSLPEDVRDCPIAIVERTNDWGWLVQTHEGEWAFLTLTGKILTLPQQKIRPAAAAGGVDLSLTHALPEQAGGEPLF